MNDSARVERVKAIVRNLCNSKNIKLIVEEWCEDASRALSVPTTHVQEVAVELGIKHLACDPGISERATLGLKTREQIAQELGLNIYLIQENSREENVVNEAARDIDQKREQYWLDRIAESGFADKDIILVCGYGHADSFVSLARKQGFRAEKC